MNILITICARGGSKGIPGKNIKMLNSKPLIGYSIDLANQVKKHYGSVDVELSTDSAEIKQVAESCGLKSDYVRPDYLANDTCGKVDAINDIVKYAEEKHGKVYDYVLDLD
ncbi:MAG TPA: acylneuraminate cytidylyltransferase family protein, partial [Paludibacteraceae bacterium]|nr:acylneuraminate cytidylyltransferase family protein [Paludibacteraceae bacterium]